MSPLKTLPALVGILLLAWPAQAGERTPGKYSGVVIFDRWDACLLYSGVYVMYVSESAKEKLREFAGKSIQIDAKEVRQPINPGDGLITDLTHLGEPPHSRRNWIALSGLTLRAVPDFKDGERPSIVIVLANEGNDEVTIFGSELAPTLMVKADAPKFDKVADGPSFALVTRQAFISGGSELRTSGSGLSRSGPYAWKIDPAVPVKFVLKPGEERRVRISFDLPVGEYEFVAGYGGGVHEARGLASNLVAFDVDDKGGKLVSIQRNDEAAVKQSGPARHELNAGCVADADAAVDIGKAVLRNLLTPAELKHKQFFEATLNDGIWTVQCREAKSRISFPIVIQIRQQTGAIVQYEDPNA